MKALMFILIGYGRPTFGMIGVVFRFGQGVPNSGGLTV